MSTQWRHLNPVFEVSDIERSLAFYRDVLGLTPHWRWQDNAAGLYSGDLELYLAKADDPVPSRVAVFLEDADSALDQYRAAGAEVVQDIETKPWGLRGFTLRDPDGNRLDIAHEVHSPEGREEYEDLKLSR